MDLSANPPACAQGGPTCLSCTKDSTLFKPLLGELTKKSCKWYLTCVVQARAWEDCRTPNRIRYLNDQIGCCADCPRTSILKNNKPNSESGRSEPQQSKKPTTCVPPSSSNGSRPLVSPSNLVSSLLSGFRTVSISEAAHTRFVRGFNRKGLICNVVCSLSRITSLLALMVLSGWLFMALTR